MKLEPGDQLDLDLQGVLKHSIHLIATANLLTD